jgi:xylulose-5-phosphate/fructose-6-phosphate phosphoketolase
LPDLKVRVVNVVDLMTLQSHEEHPHGLSRSDFDSIFTTNAPVIFAYHGYPSLVHRLIYKRSNAANFHVHGYREEGTTTTPFDMTVLNQLDRFHLAADAMNRIPRLGNRAGHLQQLIRDTLVEHSQYIAEYGQDMPEIRNWRWASA